MHVHVSWSPSLSRTSYVETAGHRDHSQCHVANVRTEAVVADQSHKRKRLRHSQPIRDTLCLRSLSHKSILFVFQTQEEVHPFLHRLFTDRQIMQMPVQDLLGSWIARRRSPKIRKIFSVIPVLSIHTMQVLVVDMHCSQIA